MLSGENIEFQFPNAGYLIILLIPLLIGQFALISHRKKQQCLYGEPHLLPYLLRPRSRLVRDTKICGWILIWILICAALMSPFGNSRYSAAAGLHHLDMQQQTMQTEVIFLVDTSASMGVPDGYDGQTRLESAKILMEEVLRQLKGQTVAVYAFTSELTSLVPPTLDYIFTRISIRDLHIDEGDSGGVQFASVLSSLKERAFPYPSSKQYVVLLMTDGGDTNLEKLTGEENKQERIRILQAISDSKELHLRLLTIGFGSLNAQTIPRVTYQGQSVTSKLEPVLLEMLAEKGRGKYFQADKWNAWPLSKALIEEINLDSGKNNKLEGSARKFVEANGSDLIVDLYYQIPLGLALFFYMIYFLLPDRLGLNSGSSSVIKGVMLFLPFFSLSGESNFAQLSREAEALWAMQDYEKASRLYTSILAQPLLQWQQARILYNLGTLQLAQRHPLEALSYYKKIKPVDLSLPQFGRNLALNEGISYLLYANALPLPPPYLYDVQLLFTVHALQLFKSAFELEIREGQEEGDRPSRLIMQWRARANGQFEESIKQKKEYIDKKTLKTENEIENILESGLQQSLKALILFLQAVMIDNNIDQKAVREQIENEQHRIFIQTAAFLPAVLNQQQSDFQRSSMDQSHSSCQESPWDQVIPHYTSGYRAAQKAEALLKIFPVDGEKIISAQMKTIQEWAEALQMLVNPPSSLPSKTSEDKLTDSLGQMQEMFMQDRLQSVPENKELHTW